MAGLPLVKQSGLRFNTGIGPRDGVAAAAGGGGRRATTNDAV